TVNGTDNPMNSAMTLFGRPRPTSSPNFLAMYCSSISDVSAVDANRNGPTCSLRTYLPIIFKSGFAESCGLWADVLGREPEVFQRSETSAHSPTVNIP